MPTESNVPPNGTHAKEHPKPHPEPPTDIASCPLPLVSITHPWFRLHKKKHHPLHFGRSGESRFDAPDGEYGVLYVAQDEYGAFIETFGRDNVKENRINVVTTSALQQRSLARVESRQPLRLVDLTGPGLARLGADARLGGSVDYLLTQRWALALFQHPEQPDGLCYRSRHDPSLICGAIYDRAESLLSVVPQGSLADPSHAALLAKMLERYGFGLFDSA